MKIFKHFRKGLLYWSFSIATIFTLNSCTQGIDPESFDPGVSNTQLTAPTITAVSSADGSETILSWPVVMGAGGFQMSLYNINDEQKPIAIFEDSIIDGCQCSVPTAEDTNYKLEVKTLGNDKYNNLASEVSEFKFTTFVPQINEEALPAGTDIAQWFIQNQELISSKKEEYALVLTGGNEYVMNSTVNLGNIPFTLRSDDASNPATIKMGAESAFITESGIKIKNVNFDCIGMTDKNSAIIKLSDTHLSNNVNGWYLINEGNSVTLQGCNIKNLSGRLIWDQTQPYVIEKKKKKNCIIGLDQVAQLSKGVHSIELSYSFPINFTLESSTVYSTTDSPKDKYVYFIAYVSKRQYEVADGRYPTCMINWFNNTMYHVTKSASGRSQGFANWGRLKGQKCAYVNVHNNIFVDCSSNRVVRQSFLQGQNGGMIFTFEKNCYWYNGASAGNNDWDQKDRIDFDPQLTQTEEGYFKVGNPEVINAGIGDPKGLE